MEKPVGEMEYAVLFCSDCDDHRKIAKNRGSLWVRIHDVSKVEHMRSPVIALEKFLLEHGDCSQGAIEVRFINP